MRNTGFFSRILNLFRRSRPSGVSAPGARMPDPAKVARAAAKRARKAAQRTRRGH